MLSYMLVAHKLQIQEYIVWPSGKGIQMHSIIEFSQGFYDELLILVFKTSSKVSFEEEVLNMKIESYVMEQLFVVYIR